MKDRQSLKTLGITTGVALAFIGITLGHNWGMRIGFVIIAAALILGAVYGIKKVDRAQLQELKRRSRTSKIKSPRSKSDQCSNEQRS